MASIKYSAVTMAKWRKANPEKAQAWNQRMKNWRRENPESRLLANARERAKKRDLVFTLTKEDITIPSRCPVLGLKLLREGGRTRIDPRSPTLDRINNKRGYVKGNVIVVSWRANNLKRDAPMKELARIVNFYSNGKWRA